ncbi:MAG TPA: glycosyltransferase family 39 protein [Candidatus Binataceae bacterium]|nr:glycosyltransferase family 39 protein [Candidatus Binataceae bacterium]
MAAVGAVSGLPMRSENASSSPLDWRMVGAFAGVTILIHFLTNGAYGIFRDELYFIACGEHLAWGYVDLPPMVAAIAKFSRITMGDSLFSIRFFPALAGGATVAIGGILAWELGGGLFAQFLAMLAVMTAPIFLGIDTILTMNAFDPIFWMGCAWALIRIIKSGDPRWWLMFGLSAGFGLENKESIVFFGGCLLVALMLTPQRAIMFNRWIVIGGLIALLIAMPTAIWQWKHHFPMLEELANVKATGKNTPLTMLSFFTGQILLANPFSLPIWLSGLYLFLFTASGRRFRVFGITYLLMWVAFVVLTGKVYYIAPIYPVIFAGGAVFLESVKLRFLRPVIRYALPAIVLIGGIVVAPNALPVLPVDTFIRYQAFIGIKGPKTETSKLADLPQIYADMFGWDEMTAAVAKVYNGLPPDERREAAIYAVDYGEAGAIDFYGPRYGLPHAVSGHMAYYIWGPAKYPVKTLIAINGDQAKYQRAFGTVEQVATVGTKYSMPNEHVPVFLCRDPKVSLEQLWPQTKIYR